MPTSPFKRAVDESGGEPTGPTNGKKKRKARQRKRELYQKIREDLQVTGEIPVTPEGALRPEQVPPSVQGSQPLSELVARAIRSGWATSDDVKPGLVEEMVKIVLDPFMAAKDKVAAFKALRMADQAQWERDHPEEAGKAKGGSTASVNVQMNIEAASIVRGMIERGELGTIKVLDKSDGVGEGRLTGSVERAKSPQGDK